MRTKKFGSRLLPLSLVTTVATLVLTSMPASAGAFTDPSLAMTKGETSATSVSYTVTLSATDTTSTVKCVQVEYDTAITGAGGKPTGMGIGSTTLTSQNLFASGTWGITNDNTNGISSIFEATGTTQSGTANRTIVLGGITNGSTGETTYFAHIRSYTTAADAAACNTAGTPTGLVDTVAVAFVFTNAVTVTVTVPPSLTFAVAALTSGNCNQETIDQTGAVASSGVAGATTATAVPLGRASTSAFRYGAQRITVDTNATNGYEVAIRNNSLLTSAAGDTISAWTGSNAIPTDMVNGTEGFGITTSDTALTAGTANRFNTAGTNALYQGISTSAHTVTSGAPSTTYLSDTIIDHSGATPTDTREGSYSDSDSAATLDAEGDHCVGFRVDISGITEAGFYTNTVYYTVLAKY